MKLFCKRIIYGCEARGDGDSPYLTRITLVEIGGVGIYLHIFHRSDADVFHDHPWPFVTCILRRGYLERTPNGDRRLRPGMIAYRPAEWIHRVELLDSQTAVTLVFRGREKRKWGFHTLGGWVYWKTYMRLLGCLGEEE